jgi:hypothetical protein
MMRIACQPPNPTRRSAQRANHLWAQSPRAQSFAGRPEGPFFARGAGAAAAGGTAAEASASGPCVVLACMNEAQYLSDGADVSRHARSYPQLWKLGHPACAWAGADASRPPASCIGRYWGSRLNFLCPASLGRSGHRATASSQEQPWGCHRVLTRPVAIVRRVAGVRRHPGNVGYRVRPAEPPERTTWDGDAHVSVSY